MPSSLVSVIIPVYQRPRLVAEALRSVLNQNYTNLEVIVVDDGSADQTPNVVRSFPEVHLERIQHSGYPGHARNVGVERSKGSLVAFLDSDDLWLPGKLDAQTRLFLERPDLQIAHTRELWRRDGRTISQKGQGHRRSGDLFRDSLRKCIIGPSTVMMRRELWREMGGFDPTIEVAEDYELWLRVCSRYEVAYVDEPLTVKRAGHGDQLSERYGQIEIFRIRALRKLLNRGWFGSYREPMARAEMARKCRIYAAGCRKRGRLEEAEHFEAESRLWA